MTVYLPCAHLFHYKHTEKESHIMMGKVNTEVE